MKIRTYKDEDKNEVLRLWKDCGLVVAKNDPAKDIERKLKVDPDLFLLGYDETGIIASVMGGYEGHRGWINYLAVKPSQQRKGYGKAMLQAVEILIKEKGCPKINLQIRRSNEAVTAFYSALGYVCDDVTCMGKRLKYESMIPSHLRANKRLR